jgi:UDP-glucose 4-epimerase
MKKYVVTGGAGFIGSALIRGLLNRGDGRVVVIDNLSTGFLHNLDEVRNRISFFEADIRDFESLRTIVSDADTIFHQAAIPSVLRSINDPRPSHEVNIDGTFNVLRAAASNGVRRVIYAASSSAYGDTEVLPKVETMLPCPKSPYAMQKLAGEHYCSVFAGCFGIETVALRYFNVYGPRQDPSGPYSGVISVFCDSILSRTAPTIFGDGETSRDFTFVEDVVDLNIKAAHAPSTVSGNVYNGGNGGRVTLNDVWALLQEIECVDIPAQYAPSRTGDVRHSQADTTRARRDLGYDPKFSFHAGIQRTLEWYAASPRRQGSYSCDI